MAVIPIWGGVNSHGKYMAAVLLCAFFMFNVAVAEDSATSLTIYSAAQPGAIPQELYLPQAGRPNYNRTIPGYAMVRHDRDMEFKRMRDIVRFTDVAARIDPTTVSFSSLSDPDTRVLEQSFQYDLVGADKLLERYLDREIIVDQVLGDKSVTTRGKLLSTSGGLVLMDKKGGIQVLKQHSGIRFPELPGGLITRPTLVWDVVTMRTGKHRTRVSYQTQGITWWADYNLIYREGKKANTCNLDVGAWVSIINQSGADYENAQLKLIAGDVHRVPSQVMRSDVKAYAAESRVQESGFKEKSFFEYHLYTLGHKTTLPDSSTKQLELFPVAHGVGCNKTLVYSALGQYSPRSFPSPLTDRNYGTASNKKVDVYVEFENSEKNGLGMPLPSGRIRVNKQDPDDENMEFIGEDVIDHTPRDELLRVKMGSAFDVVGERKQLEFNVDTRDRWMTEKVELTVRNHKKQDVTVLVKEALPRWASWEVSESSHEFIKEGAQTIYYPIKVPKNGQQTITYIVRYSW